MKLASVLMGMVAVILVGCSSQNTLTDEEVERERARSDRMHQEMNRETQ